MFVPISFFPTDMDDLPSHSGATHPTSESRPNQGTFHDEEQDFLKTFMPQYHTLLEDLSKISSGPRGVKGTKGRKKEWVLRTVFPKFVARFESAGPDGPNLDSLKQVRIELSHLSFFN